MARHEFGFLALVYGIGALSTFGIFFRNSARKPLLRHVAYALLWPFWWIVGGDIGASMDSFCHMVWGTEDRSIVAFAFGVFTAGYFLTTHWESCDSAVRCVGVGLQSLGVGITPIAALYWTWSVAALI